MIRRRLGLLLLLLFVLLAAGDYRIASGTPWIISTSPPLPFSTATGGTGSADVWLNVKDPRFGAKCDGVTDDQAAFAAAHTGLSAAGGTIIIPAGTCVLKSAWTITKPNVRVIGAGSSNDGSSGATKLVFTPSAAGAGAKRGAIMIDGAAGAANVILDHFLLAQSNTLAGWNGIQCSAQNCSLNYVTVFNFTESNIACWAINPTGPDCLWMSGYRVYAQGGGIAQWHNRGCIVASTADGCNGIGNAAQRVANHSSCTHCELFPSATVANSVAWQDDGPASENVCFHCDVSPSTLASSIGIQEGLVAGNFATNRGNGCWICTVDSGTGIPYKFDSNTSGYTFHGFINSGITANAVETAGATGWITDYRFPRWKVLGGLSGATWDFSGNAGFAGTVPPAFGTNIGSTTFANLGTPASGTLIVCTDCTVASPCAGAGGGALAKRIGGGWVCN